MVKIRLIIKEKDRANDILRTAYNLDPTAVYENNRTKVAGEKIEIRYNIYRSEVIIISDYYSGEELRRLFYHCIKEEDIRGLWE